MIEELLRQTDVAARHIDLGGPQGCRHGRSDAAGHTVVFQCHDQLVRQRQFSHRIRNRQHPPRVDHRHADALIAQALSHRQGHRPERPDRHQQHLGAQPFGRHGEHIHSGVSPQCRNILADIAFRESDRGGTVVDVERFAEFFAQSGAVPWCGHPHAGNDAQYGQIPHTVVAGTIRAGDPGPVEHHRDGQLMQRHVHRDLVERAVEECRIDRHHRVQSAHRQPGRRRHRVLLGDADVEQPIREALPECGQASGSGHGRGDRDDVAACGRIVDQRFGERRRPTRPRDLGGQPGRRVDHPTGMHLLGLVGLGRTVAPAFEGADVHQHRSAESAGTAQCRLDGVFVMAVDRPYVLQAEVGEQQLWRKCVLHTDFDAVHELVSQIAEDRHPAHRAAAPLQQMLIAGLQPQHGQVVGQPPERRRVTAAVVVDDDHHRPAGRRNVVQRLPAHAAGERAVADHRHHMPVAVAGQLERLGQPVGIRQRRARVARLNPVVFALGPRRITRQPTLFPQRFEVRGATGQHLVHVGLVAGVEDDRVMRRIEYSVQRQRQLDDAEVGAEVATGRGDFVDQKLADLFGQIAQFLMGEVLQIGGPTELFEHPASLRTDPNPTPRPAEMPWWQPRMSADVQALAR